MGQSISFPVVSAVLLGVLATSAAAQRAPGTGWLPALPQPPRLPGAAGTVIVRGQVEPGYTWPLLAPATGWVKQVFFAPGDYVRHRQVMLKFMHNPLYSSQLNREYILAPRGGIVAKRHVEVGTQVRVGMCVALVQDVAQVKVPLWVPAQVGQAVRVCDPAVVRVAELPGRTFIGTVETVLTPGAGQSRTQVTVVVPNGVAPRIRPRMHASVLLDTRPAAPSMARR